MVGTDFKAVLEIHAVRRRAFAADIAVHMQLRDAVFLPVPRKHFGYHLIELAFGFALTAVFAYILESRSGSVHEQGWAFYVVAVCLYLVFAFPAFVWRYFWHSRNKE